LIRSRHKKKFIGIVLNSNPNTSETFFLNKLQCLKELDFRVLLFVDITIYDMLGNVVYNLVNANESPGYKSIQWDATNNQGQPVSAGVYLYTIEAGEYTQTKKMVLLK